MRGCRIALGIACVLIAPTRVSADCGHPNWIGTSEGTSLPSSGVLYELGWHGVITGAAWSDRRQVEAPGRTFVYEIRYRDAAEYVSVADTNGGQLTFRTSASWQPPSEPPRVVLIGRVADGPWCTVGRPRDLVAPPERFDPIAIQVDQPVAAFRVRWFADGAWSGGILPPEPSRFRSARSATTLLIGALPCWNDAVPMDVLADGAVFDITAIRFDGGEVPVTGVPHVLDLDDYGLVIPFAEIDDGGWEATWWAEIRNLAGLHGT
jgi:hypothetical protein